MHTVADRSGTSVVKNVTLKAGSSVSLSNMSRCMDRSTDKRTMEMSGKILNECYVPMTLDKLRELDGDKDAQDSYIMSRSKFLDSGNINVLSMHLILNPEDKLNEMDYDYINNLLSWSRNDIYLLPTIEYNGEIDSAMKCNRYDEFVKRLLYDKSSWCSANAGMMIPSYYPRRKLDDLFGLYEDEDPLFIAVDFDNKRMDNPSQTVSTLVKRFKDREDGAFMYAVNLKPYKKGHIDESAWDVYAVHGTFNAIGPTHPKPKKVVLPNDWSSAGRVFSIDEISYPVLDDEHREGFFEWTEENYGFRFEDDYSKNTSSVYNHLKRFNYNKLNILLQELSKAIDQDDEDFIDSVKERMPAEMKDVRIDRDVSDKGRKRKPLETIKSG